MKLIKFSEVTDAYLADHLLLLNTSALSTHYVARLISRDSTSVATKGGLTLPPELWDHIIKLSPRRAPEDKFVLVEAKTTSETETEKVLSCQEVKLKVGFGWEVDDWFALDKCEELLRFRSRVEKFSLYEDSFNDGSDDEPPEDELFEAEKWEPELLDGELPEDKPLEDGLSQDKLSEKPSVDAKPVKKRSSGVVHLDTTYQIVIRADRSGHPCVFSDLTVPDVIARVEGGNCSFCNGERFISPCCMEGAAREFGLRETCGVVIVCPLCVGIDLAGEQDDILDNWDYHGPKATKKMDIFISRRFRELGYKGEKSPEGCCY